MSNDCQALQLSHQLKRIERGLNALLHQANARPIPERALANAEAPTVVVNNVVECRRSGARKVIFKTLEIVGPSDVYSISKAIYGDGTQRHLTKTCALLYTMRGNQQVEWEGPLRPSTKVWLR